MRLNKKLSQAVRFISSDHDVPDTSGISLPVGIALAFLAGICGALSMPGFDYWPLIFVSFSVFYFLLDRCSTSIRRFFYGWFFGFGFHLLGLHWIGNALLVPGNPYQWAYPLALTVLPLFLGLYSAIASWLTRLIDLKTLSGFILFIAIFSLAEWARGHAFSGFPWNLYGYSWSWNLPLSQSVSVIGIYGLTLLTVALATLPGWIFTGFIHGNGVYNNLKGQHWGTAIILAALICGIYLAGKSRLSSFPASFDESRNIIIVQPDIPQAQKWDPSLLEENFLVHLQLTRKALAKKPFAKLTYIIWPESALSPILLNSDQARSLISQTLSYANGASFLLSGTMRMESFTAGNSFYNSLILMDKEAKIIDSYDKNHLVPFGEYIPFSDIIDIAPVVGFSGFKAGESLKPLYTDLTDQQDGFIPLICYEAIFPHLPKRSLDSDPINSPRAMINVTNDGWYGDTAGPIQHFHQSRFRAIETGYPLIRAANTGISGVIDPLGRVKEKLAYHKKGYIKVFMPLSTGPTFYNNFGLILFWSCLFVMFLIGSILQFKLYSLIKKQI